MDRTKSDLGLNSYNEYSTQHNVKRKNIVVRALEWVARAGIATWILLVAVWAIASCFNSSLFLPDPIATIKGGATIVKNGVLFEDIGVSLLRIAKGWSLGLLFAIPVGLLIGRFDRISWLLEPLINFFRFVPAIGFLTLFLMWFGVGETSKVVLIFYATVFPVIINTIVGVRSVDASLVEASESLGASSLKTFFSVIVPSTIPHIFTGIRLGLSGAIISIVAAEMLAASEGIGYLIYTSRLYYRTDWIFVGIIVLGLIGFLADRLLLLIGKKCLGRFGVVG